MSLLKENTGLKISILSVLLLLITSLGFKVDDPVIANIVSKLDQWLDTFEPEKVYLQFDKPYYAAGEDIWFKAVITAGDHKLSAISRTLNVELSDEKDSLIKWIRLPVKDGLTWGDFALPDSLQAGNYHVRAYTNWMRNAGADYFFDRVIPIGRAYGSQVDATADFSYTSSLRGQKGLATISFKTKDGLPLSDKEVNYHLMLKPGGTVFGGKAMINNHGEVKINFNSNGNGVSAGVIIASIRLSGNESVVKNIRMLAPPGPVDFQLFPEGGYLVTGLRSRVAFKAVGADGLGREISGKIVDNDQHQIALLNTKGLGMGDFWFTPEAGKTYKAVLTNAGVADQVINLPEALKSGYVLHVDHRGTDSLRVTVSASGSFSDMGQVYVFAQSNGRPRHVVKSNAEGHFFNLLIPTNKLPSGMTSITLFSASGVPLQERLVFIAHEKDRLSLKVEVDSITSVRQKVRVELNAKDSNGNAVNGYFAAAVIDESKVPATNVLEPSIFSQLLLQSDLRGYIEQPGRYFASSGQENEADLDLLMLTQGYRRFEWKSILTMPIPPPVFKAEKFMDVSGTVTTTAGKPVPAAKVTLFSNSGSFFLLDSVADGNGHFAFRNLFIRDSVQLVLQAQTPKKNKNVLIKMDSSTMNNQPPINNSLIFQQFNPPTSEYLKSTKLLYQAEELAGLGQHNTMLKEVTIKDNRKRQMVDDSYNLNGKGNADQVLGFDYFSKAMCSTLEQCLEGRLAGVVFNNHVPYLVRNMALGTQMLVVVNGNKLQAEMVKGFFQSTSASEIGSVEVLKTPAYQSAYGGSGGVIIINLRNAGDNEYLARLDNDKPGVLLPKLKGYYRVRTFYSPRYDNPQTNRGVVDLRTTIFWKPNLMTDERGHTYFEYENAGAPGTYRITIEGIDATGKLGMKVVHYKVK